MSKLIIENKPKCIAALQELHKRELRKLMLKEFAMQPSILLCVLQAHWHSLVLIGSPETNMPQANYSMLLHKASAPILWGTWLYSKSLSQGNHPNPLRLLLRPHRLPGLYQSAKFCEQAIRVHFSLQPKIVQCYVFECALIK